MKTNKQFAFSNGDKVEEKITGFNGVITGTCFYITGCNQYLVTTEKLNGDGKPVSLWYDEGRLTLMEDAKVSEEDVAADDANGCDVLPSQGERG